jgi:hypothetical protein
MTSAGEVRSTCRLPGRHANVQLRGGVPKWLRERSAKPRCSGSNPLAASNQVFQGDHVDSSNFSSERTDREQAAVGKTEVGRQPQCSLGERERVYALLADNISLLCKALGLELEVEELERA